VNLIDIGTQNLVHENSHNVTLLPTEFYKMAEKSSEVVLFVLSIASLYEPLTDIILHSSQHRCICAGASDFIYVIYYSE
jgi:hypothetical protein